MTRNDRPRNHPANGRKYSSIFEFAEAAERGEEWEEEEYAYSRNQTAHHDNMPEDTQ